MAITEKAITEKGYLVLGTFSDNGPTKCSGLEIMQYNEASMSHRFETNFNRIKCITEDHLTPFNTIQNFVFCSFQKKHLLRLAKSISTFALVFILTLIFSPLNISNTFLAHVVNEAWCFYVLEYSHS